MGIPIPSYSEIMELIKRGATIEYQEKIMALREAVIELQEENQDLRKKVRELEEDLAIKGNLKFEVPYYWLEKEGKKDGPYCQVCYDKERKLIRLQQWGDGRWKCFPCTSVYHDSSYRPPDSNPSFDAFTWSKALPISCI
jgi:ketosteroid isomerase-like protein